ncbi:MAG TPA: ABC transporter, partial [Methylophilaceae bacterium]|nr:ABC transporter [Methylophilaceae bacterium]
ITNGGNLDLGVNVVNWLTNDDKLITIQPMVQKDINMTIPSTGMGALVALIIGYGFQIVLPALFLIFGFVVWFKRRKA